MTYLLDVNVLIALLDPKHIEHGRAHLWLGSSQISDWATCPIVQNGVLRIVSHRAYANSPGSPAAIIQPLRSLLALPGHVFWPDDLSLLYSEHVDITAVLTSAQVTDTYLLALAVSKGGRLATFDRRLSPAAVRGGRDALHLIGS